MNLPFVSGKGFSVPFHPLFPVMGSAFATAAAFPPLGLWPLLFIALVPLLRTVAENQSPGRIFRLGFGFGFIHFALILHWLAHTVHTFGRLPWPLALGALGLLAAYLALYPALFLLLLRHAYQKRYNLLLLAPSGWVGLEYIRGQLFTGFPWAQLGHGLAEVPLLIQGADLGGVYLLSFSLMMANTALAFPGKKGKNLLLALFLWCGLGGYGYERMETVEKTLLDAPVLATAILQGSMPPDQKWNPDFQTYTLQRYQNLVQESAPEKQDLFLWPETATPFYLFSEDTQTRKVLDIVSNSGGYHLIGSPAYTVDAHKGVLLFNTSYLIHPSGEILSRYDKSHLVPFGEYVPLKDYLPFLQRIIVPAGYFTPGIRYPVMRFANTALAPLICFESVFPHISRRAVVNGAEILAVQTNDAWFGKTGGPRQHLHFSVFRAVEFRRSVIRSANTGISSLILPTGRIGLESPMDHPFVLKAEAPLLKGQTLYARMGDFFAWICLLVLLYYVFLICCPLLKKRVSIHNHAGE